ncbi:MAG: hypothetical protein PWP04_698 [Candidatus Atribacteria bacterium]|nr:hypothetical protein [Candidatus Atribacteria bacterium]
MKKTFFLILSVVLLVNLFLMGTVEAQVDYDQLFQQTAKKWTRSAQVKNAFSVEALYWSEEVVQAWVAKYGHDHLLSKEEQLAYHRDFIQREKLNRYLVFEVTLKKLSGPPLYPYRFDQNTYLVDDQGRKFFPADFPLEFEEKIHNEARGKVYFPRFDTDGEPIIGPDTKHITLHFARISIAPDLVSEEVNLTWKNPYLPPDYSQPEWQPVLEEEIVRLQERIKELGFQKELLEEKQKTIEQEIQQVEEMLKELQKQLD